MDHNIHSRLKQIIIARCRGDATCFLKKWDLHCGFRLGLNCSWNTILNRGVQNMLFVTTLDSIVFISWSVFRLYAGAARGLRQGEARHRHLRFRGPGVRDEGGLSLSVRHQRGLSCCGWCCYSPGQVSVINRTMLSLSDWSFMFARKVSMFMEMFTYLLVCNCELQLQSFH